MRKSLVDFTFVAIPKITGGLATIGLNMVLLRFLGPESFGIYSLCIFGILLADGIIGSAVDMGVLRLSPLYRSVRSEYALSIEKSAFFVKLLGAGASCLILVIFSHPISMTLFHQEQTAHLIWISCCAALAMLLLRSVQVHLQVQHRFVFYGSVDLVLNFLRFGGIALVLVLFPITPAYILTFYAASPILVFLICLGILGKNFWGKLERQKEATLELLRYVKWFLLTFSVGATISRMDIYFLTTLSNIREVGIFSGGFTYALIPELLGTYLTVVFGPRIMPYFREGIFLPFFQKVQIACIVSAIAIFFITIFSMEIVAPYLFPASFKKSSQVLLILLPGSLAAMVTFPITLSFLMFVRPSFWLTMEFVTLPLLIVCYIYAIRHYGSLGAAWTTSIFRVSKAVFGQIMACRWASLPPDSVVLDIQRGEASDVKAVAE